MKYQAINTKYRHQITMRQIWSGSEYIR